MASRNLVMLGAAAVLCVAPLALGSYQLYLAQLMMINVIAAAGLNLLTGNCGQISLCHSSFMAIGAYASALVVIRTGLSFLPALAIGTFAAALLGACLGYPARRLSGLYLALVTLGFLQLVQILIEEFPELTGGVRGLSVPKPQVLGYAIRSDFALYYVLLGAAAFAVFLADNLQRSRFGRAFNAVRQSAFAAQALGIPLGRTKLVAFTLAAGFAGLSGGLMAVAVGFMDPTEFGISTSLRQITFIVVGGLGSVAGSVLGAVLLTGLPEFLRGTQEYADLVYAAILLGSLLFMPRGIKGLLDDLWSLRLVRKPATP
ncbi:MAG: branched-chain amino acid ABC transporter permease [Alphaproteobacteria bacterium]|nr:MAG: branched-chain amino acid ABC transporter permease [Alphaproteobacteria bacterium]TMJ45869.1 MAG: branched-chain amino acid ABC transporter permease [Alphaproteobacteria bacterium]